LDTLCRFGKEVYLSFLLVILPDQAFGVARQVFGDDARGRDLGVGSPEALGVHRSTC
jgi:hypothetical protein